MNLTDRSKQEVARLKERSKSGSKFKASVFFNAPLPVIRTDAEVQSEVILVIKNIQQGKSVEEIACFLKMSVETINDIAYQYNSLDTMERNGDFE